MPATYGAYYEPFVGGAALFFDRDPSSAVLGDMNVALIETYCGVADDVEGVITRLTAHRAAHGSNGYYYEVRDDWNARKWGDNLTETAAAFIYLNKTCFNGLWRVNRRGEFNVPKGDYKDPKIFEPDALRAASVVLAQATLVIGPYDVTVSKAKAGDFVYFDPPYDPVSETSNFTSYTKDVFGKEQQRQLAECARRLAKQGVNVMLSNNDTEYVRSLYPDFCIDNVKCGRSINSKGDKRGAVDEVIITSYEHTS